MRGMWKHNLLDRLRVNVGGLANEDVGLDGNRCDGVVQRPVSGDGGCAERGQTAFHDDFLQKQEKYGFDHKGTR